MDLTALAYDKSTYNKHAYDVAALRKARQMTLPGAIQRPLRFVGGRLHLAACGRNWDNPRLTRAGNMTGARQRGANPWIVTEATSMIIDDSQRGSGFLLTESARLLRKLIDRRLQPLGLTRAQWSILAILSKQEGLSQSHISARLEIEKSTAGRLIDQVEKSGWIERRRVAGDRRAWGIHLTERARQLLAQVETVILRSRTEMLQGLSAKQQEHLSEILQTVKSNLAVALELDRSEPHAPNSEEGIF